ncbi:MAG: hypothetical protein QOH96_2289 [Blastocatellia bacterium]|nr:hypothetical protein [Blastocatellia bacterium]
MPSPRSSSERQRLCELEGLSRVEANEIYFPAREMTVHTLRYSRKSFCLDLFRQLHDSPKANEWERACAVYALGFWNCPLTLIKDAYFDTELLVRKAGEEPLASKLCFPPIC